MRSGGLGQVIYSKTPKFKVGEYVAGMFGWQKFALVLNHGVGISKIVVNVPNVKMSDFMSLLGMTGMTAYFGMMDIGKPKQGDTVVVSGAAGATGSIAGQIAKLHGCRVIGIAGTEDKCRWLQQELGFDVALNYKDPQFEKKLLEA